MSTRATYQFIGEITGTYTAYIHHDGYPQHAWTYLDGANSIDQFMQLNEQAEITDSHEIHGDTEYRYTVQNGTICAQERDYDANEWKIIFLGTVDGFVKKYKAEYERLEKEYNQRMGLNAVN